MSLSQVKCTTSTCHSFPNQYNSIITLPNTTSSAYPYINILFLVADIYHKLIKDTAYFYSLLWFCMLILHHLCSMINSLQHVKVYIYIHYIIFLQILARQRFFFFLSFFLLCWKIKNKWTTVPHKDPIETALVWLDYLCAYVSYLYIK